MEKKDFVFVLGSYRCNKKCPYCIAKMNKKSTNDFVTEFQMLKEQLEEYQKNKVHFQYFVLSGNGETSLYTKENLELIKQTVEDSQVFSDYRIQTSGNLFLEKEKLELFENWLKEITVITSNPLEDKEFYNYEVMYLSNKDFIKSKRIRVNIVLLKNNQENLEKYISDYSNMENVETIALKILDRTENDSEESKWIKENAISHKEIDKVLEHVAKENKFINFKDKRFYFITKNNKTLTIHYDVNNTYDYINIENNFSWHKRKITKGTYGEFSKIEEEVEEAKDALEQNNNLMYLIELSDILGAIEGIVEKHGLTISDLKTFSNKVKESKKNV